MIKAILFDLDGTLLPMDQDRFVKAYIGKMAEKMLPYGYDPKALANALWKGTGAMVANDGAETNETLFWKVFSQALGRDARADEKIFESYYHNEFQQIRECCGFQSAAADTIRMVKDMGFRAILATNPLFPAIATYSRVRWAGLDPSDFELITTYENSRHCKPNPEYYRDILETLKLTGEECLMVGNDAHEDTAAEEAGIRVFLLTDNLINKNGIDISSYPQGSFPELQKFIREL